MAKNTFRFFRRTFHHLFALLVTFLTLVLIFPILFCLLSPIYIFRWIVSNIILPVVRPNLGKLLSASSSMFAVDDYLTQPKCTLIIPMVVKGNLTVHGFQKIFSEKVLTARLPNGKLANPELTQYISTFMGFFCWREDPNFRIENHINNYTGPIPIVSKKEGCLLTERDLLPNIGNELVHRPFPPCRSPWEFHLIPNVQLSEQIKGPCIKMEDDKNNENPNPNPDEDVKTLVIFRTHHALGDGFSILKFLTKDISAEDIQVEIIAKEPEPEKTKKRASGDVVTKTKSSLCKTLFFFLWAPYEIIFKFIGISNQNKRRNPWHLPQEKLSLSVNSAWTEAIPLEYIQEIRRAHNNKFSTTSVILSAISGGVRNFMIEEGIQAIPKRFYCLTPVPMPRHPDSLTNHFSGCVMSLHLGISGPIKRLERVESEWRKVKTSTIPYTGFLLFSLIGGLLPWMIKLFRDHSNYTALFSNFPGPSKPVNFVGFPVLWVNFGGGLLPGNIGIGFSTLSYNGSIHLTVGVNQSILPTQQHVQSLVEKIQQEFHILMHSAEKGQNGSSMYTTDKNVMESIAF